MASHLLAPVRERRITRRLNNLYWERRLGISTRQFEEVEHPDSSNYASVDYSFIRRVLAELSLQPSDTFVDIGCGKGRVLCCAAQLPVDHVIGVDLSEQLVKQARQNASKLRGRHADIRVEQCLADEFDYSQCSIYYMFSPFGAQTMSRVLTAAHAQRGDQPVRIAYVNAAHREAFDDQRWLVQDGYWPAHDGGHDVAFYRG